jgi:hypothetical protein
MSLPHDQRVVVLSAGMVFAIALVLAYLILLLGRATPVF